MELKSISATEILGNGTHGIVYLCRTSSGSLMALKDFGRNHAAFREEQSSLMVLQGVPHVAQIHFIGNNPDHKNTMLMKYYQNGDLFSFMETSSFSERLAKTLIRQCLVGLKNIHARNVVHRDIKPENLFVDENFQLVFGDFAYAEITDDVNYSVNGERGTRDYMAPEMFTDYLLDGRKTDVWSIGCIFFLMLLGSCPFGSDGPRMNDWYLKQLAKGNVDRFWEVHARHAQTTISREARDFIDRIFVLNPRLRPCAETLLDECEWINSDLMSNDEFVEEMSRIKGLMRPSASVIKIEPPRFVCNIPESVQGEAG